MALKEILVPLDFSPLSEKALRYAARLAEKFGAGLTLLHVIEPEIPPTFEGMMIAPPTVSDGADAWTEKQLNALAKSLAPERTGAATALVRRGLAAQEIVDVAKELDVDLIVMGTHGYTGWKHFCIGSTAERVVRAASCPVLVVRQKEHDFI